MEKCSVVLALYNGKEYIKEQINSIINQTIKPNELIIIDDCSTDGSYEYVCKYIELIKSTNKNISFCLLKNEQNIGYVRTFAKALNETKYDIVFLSDQDDFWLENKIEDHIKIYEENDEVYAVASQMIITDKYLNITKKFNETYELEYIDTRKTCFGAKMFYGCQISIKKNEDFNNLVKSLYDDRIDVHDRLLCYYYAGINSLVYFHKNHLYHRIHENNSIGHHNKKGNFDKRIEQAKKDISVISCYKEYVDNKILSFNDIKNRYYIDQLINFRIERKKALETRDKYYIIKFAIKNLKYYSLKRVFIGDIIYSLEL